MRQQERRVQRPPLDEPAQSKEHSSDSSAAAATASRSDGPADPAAPDAAPESKARQRHQQVVEACLHPSLPRSPAHAKQSSRPELLGAMRSTVSSLLGEALYVRETLLLQRVVRGWLGRASARREREWQEDELRADVEAEVRRELATSMQLPWPEPFQRDDLSVRLAPEARDVRLRVERRKRVRVLALTWNMHGTVRGGVLAGAVAYQPHGCPRTPRSCPAAGFGCCCSRGGSTLWRWAQKNASVASQRRPS